MKLDAKLLRRSDRLVVALCAMVAVFEGIDLQAPGVAAPRLMPALGLKPAELGPFFSASTFGLMLGAAIGGRLSDRFGRKVSLLCSIALFGALSILTGLAGTLDQLVLARFLTGVGLGGALPNLLALVAEHSRGGKRSAAVGFLYAGLPCGGALASLVSYFGSDPSDWRGIFFLGGVLPLAALLPLSRLLPSGRSPYRDSGFKGGFFRAVFSEGRNLSSLLLWLGFFLALLTMYLLLNWLPSLLIGRGLSRPDAALVQMAFNLCGAGGSIATGWLMDHGWRRWLVITAVFSAAALVVMLVASVPPTLAVSLAVGGALGATVSGTQAILYGLAPSVYPWRVRGTGVGVAVAMGRLGSAVGPLLAAQLLGAGRSPSDVLLALLPVLVVAGLATIFLALRPMAED
jgi:AAHS family 3-hydroxyphenylpropionic acid transporter